MTTAPAPEILPEPERPHLRSVPARPAEPATATLPPGSRTPAFWQSLRYVRDPYRAIEYATAQWGYPSTAHMPGQPPLVNFSDPEAIRDIFTADEEQMNAGEATAWLLSPILGSNSLLVLDGARHLRERRLMVPSFHGERIQVYGRIMREITERVVGGWPLGRAFPIHREMQTITLEVIMRAVFGVDEGPRLERLRACLLAILRLADSTAAPFLFIPALRLDFGRWSPWGRFLRDRRELRDILMAEIARRRTEGTGGRDDVLSMLVDARDETGAPMSDDELVDEMFTLLMAGHETTATSLAWTFVHLLPRRDLLERLRAELRQVTGGGPVEPEHVTRLELLDAVLKETARITPVATNVVRILRRPARIGGVDLPAGVGVSCAIYATHHRPDLWPDPHRFDPDRFLGTRPAPYTFFPFGGGLRRCIGAAFATYEMKVILATVLSRVELRLAPGHAPRPRLRTVTVAPAGGVPVLVDAPVA